MGNCANGRTKHSKSHSKSLENPSSPKMISAFTCPNCCQFFPKESSFKKFNQHIRSCVVEADDMPSMVSAAKKEEEREYVYEKMPDDNEGIRCTWLKIDASARSHGMQRGDGDVGKWPFQAKQGWFRQRLQTMRIGWETGCDWIEVNKKAILLSSIRDTQRADMHREVKIKFDDEPVHDAGGLLREWIHLLTKEIFAEEFNLFKRAQTDEMCYKLNADSQIDEEFAVAILELFGKVIGKALFERIPIRSYLDRTILRQLCGQKIQLADIHSFDRSLYESWKFLAENPIDEDLEIPFAITQKAGNSIREVELTQNGSQILVTEANKQQYIQLCIDYYCTKKVQKLLSPIQQALYAVVPVEYLAIFEPYELEMLLYGVPFIDVGDWRANTTYMGAYYAAHKTVLWFWEYLEEQEQGNLAKMLQFCTGSSRTPIHGFTKLESNRGNFGKFTIESRAYDEKDPYPKGHTCFNRLELPVYPRKELVCKFLAQILSFHTEGLYGLD